MSLTLISTYFVLEYFMDAQPLNSSAMDYVRSAWATYFIRFYNSKIVNE